MTLLIITIILAVITALGVIIGIWWYRANVEYEIEEHNKNWSSKKEKPIWKKRTYLYSLLSICWVVILVFGTFTKINANEVGIIYDDRAGILEKTYTEGFQTKSIFEHITKISTINRNANVSTTGQTNDGQYASFEISIIYRIDSADAGKFYKKTNSQEISNEQLNSLVKQSLQSSTIKYDIFELLSEGLEPARITFQETLSKTLYDNYYITLVSATFDDVDAGESIETIMQQKAEAEQKIEIAKKTAEAELITAENQVKLAEQKAAAEKILADAQAYAIKIEGEATAETSTAYATQIMSMIDNMQVSSNLTYKESADLVLSIVFYDTWDGKLPDTLTSDSLSSLIGSLITK